MSVGTKRAPAAAAKRRRLPWGGLSRWFGPAWIWILFVLIVLLASVVAEPFLTARNLTNVLRQMIPLGIVALGQTLVILLAGVDLAVAATIGMANTALMGIVAGEPSNILIGIVIALAGGLAIGLFNGLVVVTTKVPALIVTLGTASIVTGITFGYTGQTNFGKPADMMADIGFGSVGPVPILFFLYALLAVVLLFVQNRTALGTHIFAVGGSEDVARNSGIRVARVQMTAYALCGVLAAVAGIAMSTRMGAGEPLSGAGFDWDSIVAVVVGGTALTGGRGGVGGTIVGVAIISVLNNVMNLAGVSSFAQIVAKGLIVLLAVVMASGSARRLIGHITSWVVARPRVAER